MKSIFKHPEKIDISSIADNEASKTISFLFMIHKSFCGDCKKVFKDYQTLGLKIAKSFDKKLVNTRSEKIFNFYSTTLKAAVYALVVGITFSSVGIAFAQTQTDLDIIPDVTFFEDGEIISFSEEEVENLFTEVIDPIQATLITFIEPDEITVDEVVTEIEDQVEVLTTLVPEDDVVTEEEPVVTEEEPVVTEEEPVVTEEEPVVTEEEPVVTEEVSELTGLQNALNQVEQNIALAIQNNNENALNGLENAKEKILENIEKAEEKLQKGNEKAKKEIEEAKEKADKILAKVDPSSEEKEVVKAQLKAERTLQKAEEKAEKELEKAQKEAEKELEKAQKEAKEETEKAQKEAEKAEKKAQKDAEKKDK